ncbi:MAG: hypothetical protein AB1671_20005 [Thermodesulfobacteriota bacterium]
MAASEDTKKTPATPSVEDEIREDMWLYAGGSFGKSARWFALSTVAHILVLALFATTAITIAQRGQELIKVKTLALPDVDPSAQSAEEPEDWEGEPSLRDLPGLLTMEQLTPRSAHTPAGPPPPAGPPVAVRAAALPTPPVMSGLGPMTIGVGTNNDNNSQFVNAFNAIGSIGGAIGGIGGGFGDYVGGLRKVGLDVVLVVDATDSMQFVIDSVKSRLIKLVTSLRQMVPTSRIGIVAYRDKGEEYVTRWVDLSFSTSKLQDFLANLRAGGGGTGRRRCTKGWRWRSTT